MKISLILVLFISTGAMASNIICRSDSIELHEYFVSKSFPIAEDDGKIFSIQFTAAQCEDSSMGLTVCKDERKDTALILALGQLGENAQVIEISNDRVLDPVMYCLELETN